MYTRGLLFGCVREGLFECIECVQEGCCLGVYERVAVWVCMRGLLFGCV